MTNFFEIMRISLTHRLVAKARLLIVVALLANYAAAQIAEPNAQPVLRLETGMHTAQIAGVAVDRAGRFLVTASYDKTARVWDAATNKLLGVLRPPLGANSDGKLFAIAISPDGNTIAVGGSTSGEQDKTHSIYIFDRASGRVTKRIGNLPAAVFYLVFSPDNKRLAATLAGANGVRLYNTVDWRQSGADANYADASRAADFDRDGKRLATSSDDGLVRLYAVGQNDLQLISKIAPSGGKQPHAIKFSPDNTLIAVGFTDSLILNVLSAADLSLAFAPATILGNYPGRNLSNVAWSANGDTLFAGGEHKIQNYHIWFWDNGGRGKPNFVNASLGSIENIQTLPDGGVVYGTNDPAWGILNRAGKRTDFVASSVVDHRLLNSHFEISRDGTKISFGYEFVYKAPALFSIIERRLEAGEDQNQGLSLPRTEGLNVTAWIDAR